MGQLRQLQGRNEPRVRRDQRVSIMGSPFPLPAHNHNAEYHGSSRLRACSVTISEARGETPAQQSVAMKVSLLLIRLISDHPSTHRHRHMIEGLQLELERVWASWLYSVVRTFMFSIEDVRTHHPCLSPALPILLPLKLTFDP